MLDASFPSRVSIASGGLAWMRCMTELASGGGRMHTCPSKPETPQATHQLRQRPL